jgi:hypothetical protein
VERSVSAEIVDRPGGGLRPPARIPTRKADPRDARRPAPCAIEAALRNTELSTISTASMLSVVSKASMVSMVYNPSTSTTSTTSTVVSLVFSVLSTVPDVHAG